MAYKVRRKLNGYNQFSDWCSFSECHKSSRKQNKQTDGSVLRRYGHSNTNISVTAQLEYFLNVQRTYPSTTTSAAELLMKDWIPAQWLFRSCQIDYKFSNDIFNIYQVLCCSELLIMQRILSHLFHLSRKTGHREKTN